VSFISKDPWEGVEVRPIADNPFDGQGHGYSIKTHPEYFHIEGLQNSEKVSAVDLYRNAKRPKSWTKKTMELASTKYDEFQETSIPVSLPLYYSIFSALKTMSVDPNYQMEVNFARHSLQRAFEYPIMTMSRIAYLSTTQTNILHYAGLVMDSYNEMVGGSFGREDINELIDINELPPYILEALIGDTDGDRINENLSWVLESFKGFKFGDCPVQFGGDESKVVTISNGLVDAATFDDDHPLQMIYVRRYHADN